MCGKGNNNNNKRTTRTRNPFRQFKRVSWQLVVQKSQKPAEVSSGCTLDLNCCRVPKEWQLSTHFQGAYPSMAHQRGEVCRWRRTADHGTGSKQRNFWNCCFLWNGTKETLGVDVRTNKNDKVCLRSHTWKIQRTRTKKAGKEKKMKWSCKGRLEAPCQYICTCMHSYSCSGS